VDLAQRRQQLRQKQVDKVKKFRQSNQSSSDVIKKRKEREQMKKDIRKEIEQENQNESINIENSDGVTFARVMDIVGPSNMKPLVSGGLWKGTEQISEKKSDCECDDCGQDPCIKCGESHHKLDEEETFKQKNKELKKAKPAMDYRFKNIHKGGDDDVNEEMKVEKDDAGPGTENQQQKQIDSKQKKADQIKKQVLLKKLQAVRQGGGNDIMASYSWREDKNMRINKIFEGKKKGLWDNIHAKRKRGEKPAKPGDKDYPKTLNVEGAAWTKKSGKSASGGLNEKGRKSYERENPGSDLKAPQPEGGSRKKSFCARMGGMKKKLTSSKTANDPDSRINKALRKWKC